jgi:putative transposase
MDMVATIHSIRRKSKVLGIRRQTYYSRKQGHRPEQEDKQIAEQLHAVTQQFVAWGFWMVFHFLRRKGHIWNHKRVYRVWKAESLHLHKPPKRPKLRRLYQDLLAPEKVNQGWAMDFVSEWVIGEAQQRVRIINIMDECSRKALWTEAKKSIPANDLTDILDKLVEWRGCPAYIRCDNGPEFISEKLELWATNNKVELRFIQPGKPTQNGLIERLNGTLRMECLNLEWFKNLDHLNERIQGWWLVYNYIRPHSSIEYKTPDELEQDSTLYFKPVAA